MRTAGLVGRMTREQRDVLRKQIDARVRARLSAMAPKGPRQTGHVPTAPRRVTS